MANHAALIRAIEGSGLPVNRRGRNYIEFNLGGNQFKHVATIEPLYIRNSDIEIDTAWVADTGAWQWKINSTDYQAHCRNIFNVGGLYEWRITDQWIVVDPQSINWINEVNSREQIATKQAVTGVPTDCSMYFENAYGTGRHFEYIAHPKRLIKHIIIDSLASLPAPTITGTIQFEVEFTITNSAGIELWLDGVKWARSNNVRVRTSNRIEFRSETTGEVLWYADAPVAIDANGETVSAQYEVRRTGGTYFITVRVPKTWLDTATFPVRVDPTFTDGYGGDTTTAKDTHFWDGDSDRANGTTTAFTLQESAGASLARALIGFDLSSIADTATCDSATLSLFQQSTQSSVAYTLNAYSIASGNSDWVEGANENPATAGQSTWDNKKDYNSGSDVAWAGSAGLSTATTDYETTVLGSYNGNRADAAGTEYQLSLNTTRVAGWFGATNTNYGLLLKLSGTTSAVGTLASSDNATTGYRPKLVVVYTAGGGAASAPIKHHLALLGVGR